MQGLGIQASDTARHISWMRMTTIEHVWWACLSQHVRVSAFSRRGTPVRSGENDVSYLRRTIGDQYNTPRFFGF